jgi:N-acyl-L-homoserine lactone synthetase
MLSATLSPALVRTFVPAPGLRPAPVRTLADVQRLRYEVYCLERHFEDASRFLDQREQDEYDPYSIHLAATDHERAVVATVRLVLDSALGFPLERYVTRLFPEFDSLPRDRTAEISRLAVARPYRHLDPETQEYPLLFGLFLEIYQASRHQGLEHLLAVMERSLWRLLRRFGLVFHQIGEPVEHRGERIPFVAEVRALGAQYGRLEAGLRTHAARRTPAFAYEAVAA